MKSFNLSRIFRPLLLLDEVYPEFYRRARRVIFIVRASVASRELLLFLSCWSASDSISEILSLRLRSFQNDKWFTQAGFIRLSVILSHLVVILRRLAEESLTNVSRKLASARDPSFRFTPLRMTRKELQEGFIKLTKKTLVMGLIFSILLPTFILYSLFKFPKSASAAWYDDSWTYRQRVDITNGGTNQTDYQVSITLDTATLITAGKVQSDCDDLRITDTNGKLLPHWIEESNPGCNSATTKIWTKAPSITTSGATVYLYYGNPSATNVENPNQVFVFYDNFSGDLSRWTIPSGCVSAISSGVLQITASTGCDSTPMYVTSLTLSDASGYAFDYRGKFSSGGSGRLQSYHRYRSTNTHMARYWISGANTYYEEANPGFGGGSDIGTSSMSTDTWYNLSSKVAGSSNNWAVNGTTIGTSTTVAATLLTQTDLTVGLGQYNTTVQYDNVRVRKSATTEPAIAAPTNEEKGTSPVAYWKFDEGNGVVANNSQWKNTGSTMTNLIVNPSAETNVTNWATQWAATIAQSSTYSAFGSYSGKVVTSGATGDEGIYVYGTAGNGTFYGSVWVKGAVAGGTIKVGLQGTGSGTETSYTLTTGWQRITTAAYTESSGARVDMRIFTVTSVQAITWYTDGVQIETTGVTNYCDGSLTGNGTHSWTGTAHGSTSTCSNGTDGMISGATWQSEDQCISGKCLSFDGTDDVVTTGVALSSFVSATDASYSVWIKPTGTATVAAASYSGRGVIADDGAFLGIFQTNKSTTCANGDTGDKIYVENWDGSEDCVGVAYTASAWTHIVLVHTGGTLYLYKDGALVNSTASGNTQTITGLVRIGKPYTNGWQGQIDEPKIYNFALSAAQIKANYNAKASGDGASSVIATPPSGGGPLSNGLVGYWKMDEASWTSDCATEEVLDASGNANNGESCPSGAANDPVAGKFGNAGDFDGTDDYVNIDDSTTLEPASNVTVSAWIKADAMSGSVGVIGKASDSNWTDGYGIWHSGTSIRFYVNDYDDNFASYTIATGSWYHVVGTFDGTTIRIFVNGVEGTSDTLSSSITHTGTANLQFGTIGSWTTEFNGAIDEARVYNRALSPDEVSQLYNFAPGPANYWKFDDATGITAVDIANSNNATITSPTWISGKFGKAVDYDGTTSSGTHQTSSLITGARTISAWVKPNFNGGGATGHTIWEVGGSCCAANQVMLFKHSSDYLYWRVVAPDGVTIQDVTLATPDTTYFSSGRWMHIAGTYEASGMKLYINGVLVGSRGAITVPTSIASSALIGNGGYGKWKGSLDDVKIYNYARTAKQIVEDMNAGHPAPGSPVGSAIGHWKFDEGADNTCSGGTNDFCNSGSYGSGLDGAKNGTVTYTQAGKMGRAISPDGTTGYGSVADNASLDPGTNDFSISVWLEFPLAGSSTWNGIVSKGFTTSAPANTWGLVSGNPATDLAYQDATNAGGAWNVTVSFAAASLSGWHHVVVTRSGTAYVMYVDGVSKATGTGLATVDLTNANALQFANAGSRFLSTDIDEVKFYNYKLTPSEVKLDMNRGQAQVLGATSDNSSYAVNAANQEYCVPGDSTSCVAPVGRWDFNEGTGVSANDSSGNGATGTLTNSPSWTVGKIGKALNFTGSSNQYVSVGTNTALNVSNNLTFEAWIKPGSDISTRQTIYGNQNSANAFQVEIGTASTSIGAGHLAIIVTGIWKTETAAGAITANAWNHIVFTRNGSGATFALYVNGVSQTLTTSSTTDFVDPTGVREFGTRSAGNSQNFTGVIDDVKLFNYARTAAQVAWDYNRGAPVGHWRFDECQGTTTQDSTDNNNDGTITIGATGTYTSAGTCPSGTATHAWAGGVAGAGKRNYALSFDGTDDYVSVTDSSLFEGGTQKTISAWFKPASVSTVQALIEKGDTNLNNASNGGPYTVAICADAKLAIAVHDTVDSTNRYASTSTLTAGQWYHMALVIDTSLATTNVTKLFINGQLEARTTSAGCVTDTTTNLGTLRSNTSSLFFGTRDNAGTKSLPYSGQLDDPRVYNYALTATQVKMLMNEGAVNFAPSTGAP